MELALLMALLVLASPVIFIYRLFTGDKYMPPWDRL